MPLLARSKSPRVWAMTALCGGVLAFYHGLWWPGLVLIKRDAFRFHLPMKQYLVERLSSGELPQWFPYDALGRPFIGVAVTGLFHPFTALYFLLPVPDAYRAATLLSCLLAGIGAFLLGRVLRFSHMGALLSAIAFALSGYVASLTDNISYLYSICVLPLFCAALEKALAERAAWIVAPAAVWATVFLNGDMQTGYYFGFIALLWAVARAPQSRRNALLKVSLAGALAILLAGAQLGPAAAVFWNSDRAHAASLQEEAMYWSMHPLRLAAIVASPLARDTDPVAVGRFFFGSPEHGLWAESLYLGIPAPGTAAICVC
jgi:membrane protein YfhO